MPSTNHQPENKSVLQTLTAMLSSLFNCMKPARALWLLSFIVRFLMSRPWLTGVTSVCALLTSLMMSFGPDTTDPTYTYDYTYGGFRRFQEPVEHPLSNRKYFVHKMHEPKETTLAGARSSKSPRKVPNNLKQSEYKTQLVGFSKPLTTSEDSAGTSHIDKQPAQQMSFRSQTGQIANGPMMLRAPGSAAPQPPALLLKPIRNKNRNAAWLTGSIEIEEQPAIESAQPAPYNGPIIQSAKKSSRSRR